MALVGSDVVDRRDPENRGKSLNGRFLEKVFLPEERAFIRSSADPEGALWALWAVKEAAWKASVKAAPADGRGWKGIRVRTGGSPSGAGIAVLPPPVREGVDGLSPWSPFLSGCADTWAGTLSFRVDERGGCTHALCLLGTPDPGERVVWQAKNRSTDARGDLIRHLNSLLNLPEGAAGILRKQGPRGLLPPRLYIRGLPAAMDISLSHDGRYAAWALLGKGV